ncbi:glycerol-3-phosphate acyltransferase 4-like [Oratosquilla oratoria]|uniref:glycerol-3-phosphate acyltransferase 4-like n=1 Tax=Oratosquilla oratoria TaxID=337810 RepID=UPI003F768324
MVFASILGWVYTAVFLLLLQSAAFGSHLGLRRLYIDFLLKLFLFGQRKLEKKNNPTPETPCEEQPTPIFDESKAIIEEEDGFSLNKILGCIKEGMEAVIDDSVTKHFVSEELPYWNLLSRTNKQYEFVSFRLSMYWILGFLVRYLLLLPIRFIVLSIGLLLFFISMSLVGLFPEGETKRKLNAVFSVFCFDFVAGCLSLVATFHNEENIPTHGIAVANHTSPIDSMILATHRCYDMVGQKHHGILGFFMRTLSRASSHIWFERSDAKDRAVVIKRLTDHAENRDLPPILIYPEGVCVNNTSVMQFKKGAFEVNSVIFPIVIKFDARYGDAFWWQDTFLPYIVSMMTSWAIVCDVWYLPPMYRKEDESAIAFANRVKAKIARRGGMLDLSWDGFLKAKPPKDEYRKRKQKEIAEHMQPKSENVGSSEPGDIAEEHSVTQSSSDEHKLVSPKDHNITSSSSDKCETFSTLDDEHKVSCYNKHMTVPTSDDIQKTEHLSDDKCESVPLADDKQVSDVSQDTKQEITHLTDDKHKITPSSEAELRSDPYTANLETVALSDDCHERKCNLHQTEIAGTAHDNSETTQSVTNMHLSGHPYPDERSTTQTTSDEMRSVEE